MNSEDVSCGAVPPRVDRAIRRGAEAASKALSRWLGRDARITVSRSCLADVTEAVEALGEPEALVPACGIELGGALPGTVLMAFEDRSAMAMVDSLLGQPEGTSHGWGALERSAAQETANIVACAFIGALAESMGLDSRPQPGPPQFRQEFAGSLLQFAVLDQATLSDRIMLVETRFAIDGVGHDWSLLIVPASGGLEALGIGPAGSQPGGDP